MDVWLLMSANVEKKNNRKSWIELVQNTNEQLGLKLWARRH